MLLLFLMIIDRSIYRSVHQSIWFCPNQRLYYFYHSVRLSFSLSVLWPSFCPSLCPCFSLFVFCFFRFPLCLSLLSVRFCIRSSVRPSVCPSLLLSVRSSVLLLVHLDPSVCLCVYVPPSPLLSVHPSFLLSVHISVCPSVFLFFCGRKGRGGGGKGGGVRAG